VACDHHRRGKRANGVGRQEVVECAAQVLRVPHQGGAAGARHPGHQRHLSDAVAGLGCAHYFGRVSLCFYASTDQVARAGPIKGPFRTSCVLGNLSPEEAHAYFFKHFLPFFKAPPGANEAWGRVFAACGGNPGLLQLCASEAAALRSWELGARLRRSPLLRSCAEVLCVPPQAAMPSCKPR